MRPLSYSEIRFADLSASDSMDFLGLLCKFLIEYTMYGMIASVLSSRSEHDVPKMPLALSEIPTLRSVAIAPLEQGQKLPQSQLVLSVFLLLPNCISQVPS